MRDNFIVIGNSWSAIISVGYLLALGKKVQWIENTGGHLDLPVTCLPAVDQLRWIKKLSEIYDLSLGEFQEGQLIREFRNKSFQPPLWEDEVELWEPERCLIPLNHGRFDVIFAHWVNDLKSNLVEHPLLERVQGISVTEINHKGDQWFLTLTSGDQKQGDEVIWADRLESLKPVSGLKKTFSIHTPQKGEIKFRFSDFGSKLHSVGAIQVKFIHHWPIKEGLSETFIMTPHRDAKENFDRRVIGYFSADGLKSEWTILLNHYEIESNHEIAKKLRKLKQTLNRTLQILGWLPEGVKDFQATVQSEQVRFEENVLWASSWNVSQPIEVHLKDSTSFSVITDSKGIESSLIQIEELFEKRFQEWGLSFDALKPVQTNRQEEDTDFTNPEME